MVGGALGHVFVKAVDLRVCGSSGLAMQRSEGGGEAKVVECLKRDGAIAVDVGGEGGRRCRWPLRVASRLGVSSHAGS